MGFILKNNNNVCIYLYFYTHMVCDTMQQLFNQVAGRNSELH